MYEILTDLLSNTNTKLIYPEPSKWIIHPWCVSIIKEYKNKIYVSRSIKTEHTPMVRINDKRKEK